MPFDLLNDLFDKASQDNRFSFMEQSIIADSKSTYNALKKNLLPVVSLYDLCILQKQVTTQLKETYPNLVEKLMLMLEDEFLEEFV